MQPKGKGKKPEVVIVVASYKATGPEQLNLEKGQLIQVKKKNESGWWEGETQVKGKKKEVGWFPATYVKALNAPSGGSDGSSSRSTADTGKSAATSSDSTGLFPFDSIVTLPHTYSFVFDRAGHFDLSIQSTA
jgi:hypothetical protein